MLDPILGYLLYNSTNLTFRETLKNNPNKVTSGEALVVKSRYIIQNGKKWNFIELQDEYQLKLQNDLDDLKVKKIKFGFDYIPPFELTTYIEGDQVKNFKE